MYTEYSIPKLQNTFFASPHGTFSRTGHMLDHKTSLNIFKNIKLISILFFDHNDTKLEINYMKKTEKNQKRVKNKQHATKQPMDQ